LTITYSVGGAGAQKEIGGRIALSLKEKIRNGTVRLNLISGTRPEVFSYYRDIRTEIGSDNIRILYAETLDEYFQQFNAAMRETDMLWTKPSELSFYVGLGIPIIMTPPIGSQERFNRQWLYEIHAAVAQKDPDYTHQWLFEMLNEGRIADMAWSGFLKARKLGTVKIIEVLKTGQLTRSNSPLER
jgi:UDP-N-acetylglucosamine:LPS N-acetylglucosamine transferase